MRPPRRRLPTKMILIRSLSNSSRFSSNHNAAYRKICEARNLTPGVVEHWTQIPAVPTAAFKELDLTCLAPANAPRFSIPAARRNKVPAGIFTVRSRWRFMKRRLGLVSSSSAFGQAAERQPSAALAGVQALACGCGDEGFRLIVSRRQRLKRRIRPSFTCLKPCGESWARRKQRFVGKLAADGAWTLNFDAALAALNSSPVTRHPSLLLGTAFSFVHLLDYLAEKNLRFDLPAGSRVMETGGYKNRSRSMPKTDLHQLITEKLGVPPSTSSANTA